MTYTLVILRIPLSAYREVEEALARAGDEGLRRIDSPRTGHLNLDGVALEVDQTLPGKCRHERQAENSLGEMVCQECGALIR